MEEVSETSRRLGIYFYFSSFSYLLFIITNIVCCYQIIHYVRFNILDAVQQQIVQAPSHERSADNAGGNNTNFSRFGSADVAKHRVRAYFQSLRDQLNVQEVAALTVVDTYIRERLCSMRQQEEDCEVILSQVSVFRQYLIWLQFKYLYTHCT